MNMSCIVLEKAARAGQSAQGIVYECEDRHSLGARTVAGILGQRSVGEVPVEVVNVAEADVGRAELVAEE